MKSEPKICDLAGALCRMNGDFEVLAGLAELFREDAPAYLSRLQAAAVNRDPAGVLHAAHSLKGLVSNFGADAASLAATRMEELARSGDVSTVAESIQALENEVSRLAHELSVELPRQRDAARSPTSILPSGENG